MPVYNQQRFVRQAINSILQQIGVDFELIIVDDGSTDDSLAIVKSIADDRMRVTSQPNRGYGAATNTGIELAQGRYIARMDSDDIAQPHRLAKQASFLDKHQEFVMVGTKGNTATPRGKQTRISLPKDLPPWSEQTWQMIMLGTREFLDPSVMFRTAIAKEIGGYRTYQPSGMDVDFWLRLLETGGKGAVLNELLYTRRITSTSIIEDPATTARNRIPRILAEERCRTGSDRVTRGEALDGLLSADAYAEAENWHIQRQWRKVELCIDANDWKSALQFARIGVVKGRLSGKNLYRMLRAFFYPVRRR